jgi:hypothetical protein
MTSVRHFENSGHEYYRSLSVRQGHGGLEDTQTVGDALPGRHLGYSNPSLV